MNKKKFITCVLCLLILLQFPIQANYDLSIVKSGDYPHLLFDLPSGKSILENKIEEPIAIASISKLMTSYLVFEKIKAGAITLDTEITYSQEELNLYLYGSDIDLPLGAKLTVDELLHLLLIRSANSSALALAKKISGNEENFVKLMNEKAKDLGMNHTHFINSHGLPILKTDEQNMSTISDIKILITNLLNNYPNIIDYTSKKEFDLPRYEIYTKTTNPLLGSGTIDGLKTGTTTKAGKCLIATATEDMNGIDDSRRVVSLLFGAKTDTERSSISKNMINYALEEFEYKRVLTGEETYSLDLDPIIFEENQVVLVPSDKMDELLDISSTYKLQIKYNKPEEKDIKAGDILGSVTLTKSGEVINRRDLIATSSVNKSGFFKRIWKKIKRAF